MIKVIATRSNGRKLLIIGLSFDNLDKFHAQPGDTFLSIDGEEMGLSFDITIFSGETEERMAAMMVEHFGPNLKVHIDGKGG
jgi:hypothetical protein